MIRIHNSLTGEKQELKPVEPGHVRMYSCGITVYDYFHVGQRPHAGGVRHGEPLPAASRLSRDLRAQHHRRRRQDHQPRERERASTGARMRRNSPRRCTRISTSSAACGRRRSRRASEYIDEMLAMIGQLIDNGYAYVRLERRRDVRRAQVRGVRQAVGQEARGPARRRARGSGYRQARSARFRAVEVREARRARLALAVGRGPPRLAHRVLGHVDEGARASTSTFTAAASTSSSRTTRTRSRRPAARRDARFAEIWMHNGFLNIDNEKMSKSLGNFFTAREVMAKIRHPEVLRFFLLSSQYRGPMNYSPDQLDRRRRRSTRLYTRCATAGAAASCTSRRRRPARSQPRWTTTSIRPKRSPCCRAWRARSTRRTTRTATARGQRSWLELRALGERARLLGGDPGSSCAARTAAQWFGRRAGAAGLSDAEIERADRGAPRGTQGQELGGIGPHPRRAGRRRA